MRSDASNGTSGLSRFLFNDLGTHSLPEVVHSRVGSLGVENSAPRSDPADPCDPAASVPPSSVGLARSGLASTTTGCSDASGSSGSAGSLPKHPNVVAQRAGNRCSTASGSSCVPRSLNNEKRDRKPPSEASMLSEQIREHRRHQCSKSALGLAVAELSDLDVQSCRPKPNTNRRFRRVSRVASIGSANPR